MIIVTYSKPEIAVIGDAVEVVQVSKQGMGTEQFTGVNPAYELDE